MRKEIEVLASLQDVDREIKKKGEAKAALLQEVEGKESEIQAKKSEFGLLLAEWKERDKVRQERERLLQEEAKKATEKRMRMSRIKNIKELQALQREIDQIKQASAQVEEELIKLMEGLEAGQAVLEEKESELRQLERQWRERRDEIEAQLKRLEAAISEAATLRESIVAQLNGDLVKRYELIFSRRGGVAVVPVLDGICQGCFMNVPPQLCNEILRGERLILCPSCHRILYYKAPVTSDKEV